MCLCINVSEGSSLGTCFRPLDRVLHHLPQKMLPEEESHLQSGAITVLILWVPMPFSRTLLCKKTEETICDFCSTQGIEWHFISERVPHFGGLWEAAMKSFKIHLKRIVGNSKLDFEQMTTILTQIKACLNSRPLGTVPHNDDYGIKMLTPGHFLIYHCAPETFQVEASK